MNELDTATKLSLALALQGVQIAHSITEDDNVRELLGDALSTLNAVVRRYVPELSDQPSSPTDEVA